MLAERQKVLVVDDDEDTRESVAELLDLLGHDVLVAASGPQAIGLFTEQQPDVVCIDIGLPGMTGHELARRLHVMAGSRRVRLIAVSGWSQPEVVARSYASGMELHIVKPIGIDTLRAIVGDAAGIFDDPASRPEAERARPRV